MAGRFVVTLTHAKDDLDRATVAFVVASGALGTGQDTVVFLTIEGVRLAIEGYADGLQEEGFAPLKELMTGFASAGGQIYVCSPCFKKRKLDDTRLVAGAKVVGGAKLVEFMAGGCPSVSF